MWRNDTKCKYMFMFPLKNLARKGNQHINEKHFQVCSNTCGVQRMHLSIFFISNVVGFVMYCNNSGDIHCNHMHAHQVSLQQVLSIMEWDITEISIFDEKIYCRSYIKRTMLIQYDI